jgi:N utilization substance protein B
VSQNRRHQRRFAFQVIYSLNFELDTSVQSLMRSFENFWIEERFDLPPFESYAWVLVQGVFDTRDTIDTAIAEHSKHWKINRIAKVELTILRLCLYEMLYCSDIPVRVAMNEAIELAKNFGDNNSKKFVNGILDAVAKKTKIEQQKGTPV